MRKDILHENVLRSLGAHSGDEGEEHLGDEPEEEEDGDQGLGQILIEVVDEDKWPTYRTK